MSQNMPIYRPDVADFIGTLFGFDTVICKELHANNPRRTSISSLEGERSSMSNARRITPPGRSAVMPISDEKQSRKQLQNESNVEPQRRAVQPWPKPAPLAVSWHHAQPLWPPQPQIAGKRKPASLCRRNLLWPFRPCLCSQREWLGECASFGL